MGGKPSAPATPNPYAVAQAQTAQNVGTAIANSYLNNMDTTGPLGSTNYRQTGRNLIDIEGRQYSIPTWSVNQTLSPDQQKLLDLQETAGRNLGNLAVDQSAKLNNLLGTRLDPSKLPQGVTTAANAPSLMNADYSNNFSEDRQRVENALMGRLNPQIERDRNSLLTRLANQGVTSGSEAYNNELNQFGQQTNDARMQAVLSAGQEQQRMFQEAIDSANQRNAVTQGNYENRNTQDSAQQALRQQAFQEQVALRNQPISEITSLLGGSAPTIPQFQQWNPGHVSDTPVGQYVYDSAKLANQQYLSQYGSQMSGMYGLGSTLLGGLFSFSDRRLKQNIRKVGKLDNGMTVYAYSMFGGPVQIGLMADEVEAVKPEAVAQIGEFKAVDYGRAVA